MALHPTHPVAASVKQSTSLSRPLAWIIALRPLDWTKNLFFLAPLLFSGQVADINLVLKALAGFGLFCILSSGSYLFNDIVDLEKDRRHPEKARRPIASGQIPVFQAKIGAVIFLSVGLGGAFLFQTDVGILVFFFLLIQISYSLGLKDWVIVDILVISAGFVLRVLAGAAVISVTPSAWIILCTVLLSLFLGFSKRRHELMLLGNNASTHRKVLEHYSLPLLDQMISAVLSATVVSYALYTINNGPFQIYSVFFVLYGMLRYLYLIHKHGEGGHVAGSFWGDRSLLVAGASWVIFMVWDIYLR